jgi:hypothetical protein
LTQRCAVSDLSTWDLRGAASQRTRTPENFLRAPAAIATADNVQPYRARELGLTDGDPDRIVRLFRPRAEVFSKDTLASFERTTLTVSHPANGVSAADWKLVAAGDVHEVKPAGDQVTSVLLVRDAGAIATVEKDGVVQLSCGYDFDLDLTSGTAPNGSAYDGVQRNIRGNHVAIVDAARGGPGLRIADHDRTTKENSMKITVKDKKIGDITVPGFTFTVADGEAQLVSDAYDRHMAGLNDCYMAHDAMSKRMNVEKDRADAAEKKIGDMEAAKRAGDAALKEATDKLATMVPAADIERIATERATVIEGAKVLAKDFKPAGLTVKQIRIGVLKAVVAVDGAPKRIATAALGDAYPEKAPEAVVTAAFSALVAMAPARGDDASAGDSADVRERDRLLAGDNDDAMVVTVKAPAKPPRFIGMDAITEANRLFHAGKHTEAEAVLAEARQ